MTTRAWPDAYRGAPALAGPESPAEPDPPPRRFSGRTACGGAGESMNLPDPNSSGDF
ncbi:MAG: hypothetical protein ABW032_06765 [Burkholderiaceae bacterium]